MVFMLVFFFQESKAQDALFSQFYSSELYLNPALAGEEKDMFFSSNYRSQWSSLIMPYVTSQISMVHPLYSKDLNERHFGGVGVSVYNDRAGAGNFKTTGANATFAYNLPLTNDNSQDLAFGLQIGMVSKNVDYSNLRWGEQYNPYIGFDISKSPSETDLKSGTLYPDINFGAIYYYNTDNDFKYTKWSGFVGFSAYHLNRPNESLANGIPSRLPILYKFHGGLNFHVSDHVTVSPNYLYMNQKQRNLIDIGCYVTYRLAPGEKENIYTKNFEIIAGVWHRVHDAAIVSLGFGNDAYTFGFSYDYNTSNLRYSANGTGAYEISLKVKRIKNHARKRIATPRI